MLRFITRYFVEIGVYTLLSLAAAIIAVAGQPSMKDAPAQHRAGYRIGYSPAEARPLPTVIDRLPPVPAEKPIGGRNVAAPAAPGLGPEETRVMLLKCASYFTIASKVFPDEAKSYKPLAIAALRAAQHYPGGTQNWIDQQDSIFIEVYQEYLEGPKRGLGLYDRYHEACSLAVRPLLGREPTED